MSYSKDRFTATFALTVLGTAALIFLILSSQIAVAALPVVGMGGILLSADDFQGNNGKVYPQYGQTQGPSHGITDTARCKQRPMLVFELDQASVNGYQIYKDVQIPYFEDRWLSVTVDQPSNSISSPETIKIYTTQLTADQLSLINVQMREGTSSNKWGPNSGEFILEGDPGNNVNPDLFATNVVTWVHALTGQQVTLEGTAANPVEIDIQYNTTADLRSRYNNLGILDTSQVRRPNYFDCLPGKTPTGTPLSLQENFESGTVPAGWNASGAVDVNQNTSNSGDYSARLGSNFSILKSPDIDLSSSTRLSLNYWVRIGGSFSETPEDGEYLLVEYRTENGDWSTIQTYEGGSDISERRFDDSITLPDGAYHSNFAVRFRTLNGNTGSYDYWHVDDVVIG